MPQVFVFKKKKWYKAETNGLKMIKFGANCLKMVAMCRSCCDQDIKKKNKKKNKENVLIWSYKQRNGNNTQSVCFRKKVI